MSKRVMDFSEVIRTRIKIRENSIYEEIEKTLRIPGLASLRSKALQQQSQQQQDGSITIITMKSIQSCMRSFLENDKTAVHLIPRRYRQALLTNQDGVWDRMLQLEWELEKKDNISLQKNIDELREGDIIVGEYFTVDQMRELITQNTSFPSVEIVGSFREIINRIEAGSLKVEFYYTATGTTKSVLGKVPIKDCPHIAQWTPHEQKMLEASNSTTRPLVDIMRYCRLRYGEQEPELAIQHFGNGPFLYLCAHWLMRKCIKERIDCILLATRDCCLLEKMMRRFQELSTHPIFKKCELIHYFCSKICFENKTPSFLQYTRQWLKNKNKVLYVNLWGFQAIQKDFFTNTVLCPLQTLFLVSSKNNLSMYQEDAMDSNPILEYLNHDVKGPVIDVLDNFQPLRAPLRHDQKLFIESSNSRFDFFMAQINTDLVNTILTDTETLASLLMEEMRKSLPLLRKKNPLVLEAVLENEELDDVSREIQKSLERKKTLSFDMFDTLVFRRGRLPKSIFVQVGEQLNDPDFCTKRIEAERQSNYGTYDEIYRKYQELYPKENALYIQKMEFQMELDNLYPILSTFLYLKPQDIIVSDMYLSENHLRQILVRCFEVCWSLVPKEERNRFPIFRFSVIETIPIVVTLHGKSQKWIWNQLQKNKNTVIHCHIGDNYHSDVISPSESGLRSLHFTSAQIDTHTLIEAYLHERDHHHPTLANLCRHVRLLNPYSDFRKKIYEEQSQINIPILVLLAIHLHSLNKRILFMLRDCFYLKMVYDTLYPGNDSEYLFCSRKAMNKSSPSFVQYMKNMTDGSKNPERKTVIFDLFGTGKSIWQFLQKHDILDIDLFYFFIYDSSECPRPSHLFMSGSDYIEKMNYVYFGSAVDIDEYDHRVRYTPEYDQSIIRVIQQALNNAIQYISSFRKDLLAKEMSTKWLIDLFNHKTNVLENYSSHVDNLTATLSLSTSNTVHMISFYCGPKLYTAATEFRHYFSQCTKTFQMYNKDSIKHLPDYNPRYTECFPQFNYGEHSRGYSHAFWRWKPFVILNRLLELKDGDLLVYHDTNVFRYPYYIDYCNEFQSCVMEIFDKAGTDVIIPIERLGLRLDRFCKKETFEIIGQYDENYRGFPLLNANRIFLRKSALSLQFVQEWLAFCLDDRCLLPETSPKSPLLWHTHDQAVLCVLYKKYIENGVLPSNAPGFTIQDKVLCHQNIRWIF